MANREISEFLTSRRAKVTPQEAGLPAYGTNRRVSGLRREEVALLAGISVEYYTRLERGSATGVSESVLDGVARALRLDETERAHLENLVRTASAPRAAARRRRPTRSAVRPSLQWVLDAMPDLPAYVRNGRGDILASNSLGRLLYAPVFDMGDALPSVPRFVFLVPGAPDFFVDYDDVERTSVALLRAEAGRDPYDKSLTALVGELSTRSERFRRLWAAHDVATHRTGTKRLRHPLVGPITLAYEAFELPADPGQRVNIYTAEPGSSDAESIGLLASWAARPGSGAAAAHDTTPHATTDLSPA